MEALARQAGEFKAAAQSASARNVFAASGDSTAERADALDQRREALGYVGGGSRAWSPKKRRRRTIH